MPEQQSHPHDDDSPMVYKTPVDYASWAKGEKEVMRSQGEDAILMSEVKNYIPRIDGESNEDYAKRYSDGLNDMIKQGVSILNDKTTHDVVPDRFCMADGHVFDLGPNSGATKKEYREFNEWFGEDASYSNCPERFLKFEVSQDPVETSSRAEQGEEAEEER